MAQDHPTCDGSRYRTEMFTEVAAILDLKFSEGKTIAGNNQELFMDIYKPKGDVQTKRPVIVLGFGGSFISGTRKDISWLCESYAKRGFVAVSIDYRLYDLALIPFPSASEMQTVVVKSIADMNAALHYLLADAKMTNTYSIDTNALFVGGISAGAIMACHTAMLDSTDVIPSNIQTKLRAEGVIGSEKNLLGSKSIKGILNFSGGLHIGDWYDVSDPPIFSYHDDNDRTVPYKKGWAQIFGQNIVELEGSFILDSLATLRGMNSELHTIPNSSGHVSYLVLPAQRNTVIDESAKFLYKLMCNDRVSVKEIAEEMAFSVSPNPFQNELTVTVAHSAYTETELLDAFGKVLLTAGANQTHFSFKTDDLSPGIYFIRLMEDGELRIEKVIKEY
jgi:para-nitrobenzyl esterase